MAIEIGENLAMVVSLFLIVLMVVGVTYFVNR